uniref:CARD domain-containing protein n=1 Tax=Biomphalaria glabrata TaxID=6526 RepID=A0A2C9LAC6_BIOGL
MSGDTKTVEMDKKPKDVMKVSSHSLLECFNLEKRKSLLLQMINSINDCEIEDLIDKLFEKKVIEFHQMFTIKDGIIKKNVSDLIQGIKSESDTLLKALIEVLNEIENGQIVEEILDKNK